MPYWLVVCRSQSFSTTGFSTLKSVQDAFERAAVELDTQCAAYYGEDGLINAYTKQRDEIGG